jgi:hypothetical protein
MPTGEGTEGLRDGVRRVALWASGKLAGVGADNEIVVLGTI